MRETQGGISEPPVPPYPVGMAEERREAIGHIYDRVAGKEPPTHNIASIPSWDGGREERGHWSHL